MDQPRELTEPHPDVQAQLNGSDWHHQNDAAPVVNEDSQTHGPKAPFAIRLLMHIILGIAIGVGVGMAVVKGVEFFIDPTPATSHVRIVPSLAPGMPTPNHPRTTMPELPPPVYTPPTPLPPGFVHPLPKACLPGEYGTPPVCKDGPENGPEPRLPAWVPFTPSVPQCSYGCMP